MKRWYFKLGFYFSVAILNRFFQLLILCMFFIIKMVYVQTKTK